MLQFTKPTELNGEQLIKELNDSGIKIEKIPVLDGNGDLWLDVAEKDKSKAETIVNAHIGIDLNIAKATAKAALLERLGITQDEANLLLS